MNVLCIIPMFSYIQCVLLGSQRGLILWKEVLEIKMKSLNHCFLQNRLSINMHTQVASSMMSSTPLPSSIYFFVKMAGLGSYILVHLQQTFLKLGIFAKLSMINRAARLVLWQKEA